MHAVQPTSFDSGQERPSQALEVSRTIRRTVGIVLGILLAVHLILLGFFKISSLDTWFHLKEGELYVTTRSLPAQDPFAFTTAGRQWIKYSWLADVLFYLTYAAAGFPGLIFLRLLLLFLIASSAYSLLRSCTLHPLASLLVYMASLALRFRLFLRPEILSFVLLLVTMAILLRLRIGRPALAYILLPVFVVWTNIHASFVFGLAIPGLVFLANFLPEGWATPGWGRLRLGRAGVRHLGVAVVLLPLVGLLNPHGISMLLFPFRQNSMTRLTLFREWMEAWKLPGIDPLWWEPLLILGLVLVTFLTLALLLWRWERRLDPVGSGIVLTLGVYAVFRNRAIPYFVLAVLPLLALAIVRVAQHLRERTPDRSFRRLEKIGTAACILVLILSITDQAFLTKRFQPGIGVASHFFPEQAAAFLERNRLDGRIFNSYNFGGYLMWRRWPANQLFIDGRYDGILFDEALLEKYLQAHVKPATLDWIAAAYNVEILVLDVDPERRMAYTLDDRSPWARVYWDPIAEVFVRRNERYAAFIAAHEYRLTRSEADLSYLAAYRRDPATWQRALAELCRAVQDNPENELAWQGLAQEYRAADPSALPLRLEALNRTITVLTGNPATRRLHAERANVLLQLGRVEEARAAALAVLRLDGDLLLPRYVLAAVAEQRGAWAEALDQLRAILTSPPPNDPEVQRIRGRLETVDGICAGGAAAEAPDAHISRRYQAINRSPQKRATTAPSERNGPKGMCWRRPRRRPAIRARPTADPNRQPRKIVSATAFHPRKAPTRAMRFRSPSPMASWPYSAPP
jgi:tetratricopeptide (TPR) repeat protein